MHQQNPVDAPPESHVTTRIRCTPAESCLHLQRDSFSASDHVRPNVFTLMYLYAVSGTHRHYTSKSIIENTFSKMEGKSRIMLVQCERCVSLSWWRHQMETFSALLAIHMKYLSILIRVALLALGQSLDCHSASEVSLMDMGKSVNV